MLVVDQRGEARHLRYDGTGGQHLRSMTASDGELRLKGGSYLMKIQVRVGPSWIAGQGLFAAQDMRKGTRIMQYIGEKIRAENARGV